MFRPLTDSLPPGLTKWCAYSLILLTPGSFFVLPLLWLIRRCSTEFAARKTSRDARLQRMTSR